MSIWITCQFSEESALNVTKLVMDAGEVDAGFIHLEGKNVPLVRTSIQTEWASTASPKELYMVIEDKTEKTHKVQAAVMREAVLPFAGRDGKSLSLMHETLARYSMGPEIGYGIAEYLIRTR